MSAHRVFHSTISCSFVLLLGAFVSSTPAFCGEIHDAAKRGDLAKVQALLTSNPNLVSSKDVYGDTPLTLAAFAGHTGIVDLLLENGAAVDARDRKGDTPLMLAAYVGNKVIVELLLTHKADVNAKNRHGQTALTLASMARHQDVVDALLGPAPLGKAVIYVYHANGRWSDDFNVSVNDIALPRPAKRKYRTIEVPAAVSVLTPITFLNKSVYRPVYSSGCAQPGCVLILRYGPPTVATGVLLQIQVEAGKTYYVKWGAGGSGLKLMKENDGARETAGMSPSAPPDLK